MRRLVLSDIHANIEAFKAVLEDAGEFDEIIFLGDLANFGPAPCECVELLRKQNAICVIGNHDEQIVSETPKHWWDKWSKDQLSPEQIEWLKTFRKSVVLDGHILALHGSYTVDYDIMYNTPDEDIEAAFRGYLTHDIDEVWFGHYHYQIDREINGITYRCIRPVGHHRDKDVRASYSVYEDGKMSHRRIPYDLEKNILSLQKVDCFPSEEIKQQFFDFVKNAYHEALLKKDILLIQKNKLR